MSTLLRRCRSEAGARCRARYTASVATWSLSTSNREVLGQTNRASDGFPSDLLLPRYQAAVGGKALQLTQDLRDAILSGRLVPGAPLPPTRVLAAELGISRSVVVRAYNDLVADGYIEARQGAGTRVRTAPGDRQIEGRMPRSTRLDAITPLVQTPAPLRLLGGLPDPHLFARTAWMRHYRAALAAVPDAELGYPDHRGADELRGALGAYLGRVRGLATDRDHILVCAGVTQGLTLTCRALRRAGARQIAVEEPCFGAYRDAVAMTGLRTVPIAVDTDGLDVERLADHDIAAVLLAPAHSFPTGATLHPDRRRAILAWAQQADTLIIEDDYDAELRYDRTPIGALQGHAPERVVYLGSSSKTLTPALRLGWIAAPSRLVAALDHEKRVDDMGSSLIDQLTFARYLATGDFARHLRRVRPIYRRRRDATIEALAHFVPDASWRGDAAGLHLYVELPDDVDVRALTAAAYRRGVLLEDAAVHWASPANTPPALVLGYGTLADPTVAIAHLSKAIRDVRR